jgi:putative SOS response-associated peptidase YedK
MCGRYALYDIDTLNSLYPLPAEYAIEPNYNAAPTQMMPVVTQEGVELMRWGLIPKWAKDEKIGQRLINARSETIFDKPVWRSVITKKRCLVPANGFYEWQKRADGKQPYYIYVKDQKLFMFAGVWESWSHEGKEWHTYSILTTVPNSEMSNVHDRMPVILHKDDHAQWLAADTQQDIEPLLMPYEHGGLDMFEVSKEVNVTRTNDNHLITPINSK